MLIGKIELSPGVSVEVEAPEGATAMEGQKHLIETLSFWQQLPSSCPMPGCGTALVFFARHPKSFHYYGLKCTGPKTHEMNFGERKDGTTLYVKDDGWGDAYSGGEESASGPAPAQAASAPAPATAAQPVSPTGGIQQATVVDLMRTAASKQQNALIYAKQFFPDIAGINGLTEAQGQEVIGYLKML